MAVGKKKEVTFISSARKSPNVNDQEVIGNHTDYVFTKLELVKTVEASTLIQTITAKIN